MTLSVLAATPLTQAKQDPIFLKYKSIFLAAMSEANAFASNEGFGKIVLTYEPKTPTNYILDHGLPLFERDQPMWELGVDEARGSIAEALPTLMKFIEVVTSNLQAVSSGASN